jgi:hypothetical protein
MDGREGTDAWKSANQPWRTTILSRRQGESGAWPCAISLADWLAPAARDFCVSVGYRVHPILIWRIAIAFWNSIQLTSQSEKSCQMAVPPNRALLVAEVPFSGRALGCGFCTSKMAKWKRSYSHGEVGVRSWRLPDATRQP